MAEKKPQLTPTCVLRRRTSRSRRVKALAPSPQRKKRIVSTPEERKTLEDGAICKSSFLAT
jgi:hypothetical protein